MGICRLPCGVKKPGLMRASDRVCYGAPSGAGLYQNFTFTPMLPPTEMRSSLNSKLPPPMTEVVL